MTELKLSPAPLYPHQKFDETLAKRVADEIQEGFLAEMKKGCQVEDLTTRVSLFIMAFAFIKISLRQDLVPDWVKEVAFCDGNQEAMKRWFAVQMEKMKEVCE